MAEGVAVWVAMVWWSGGFVGSCDNTVGESTGVVADEELEGIVVEDGGVAIGEVEEG